MNTQSPGFSESPLQGASENLARTHWWLWITFFAMVATVSIGLSWDKAYHATHSFDTFYSPPHLFIYSMTILTMLLFEVLVFSPRFRTWFGPGFRLPLIRFEVPGALVITGSGLAMLGFAGLVLDNLWHSNFGLDETAWTTPHAMLGWSWFIATLGFISCRLALRSHKPVRWYTAAILGYLILGFSASPILGPLWQHHTPEMVQAIASIPTLADQSPVQHASRIYLEWHLDRTNPLFIPLGAVWAGSGLALVRSLDRRVTVLLMAIFVWSLMSLIQAYKTAVYLDQFLPVSKDPASWLPLPIFPAAIVMVVMLKIGLSERWAWAGAGIAFGLITFLVWGTSVSVALLVILAAPAMVAGALVGKWIYRILENPSKEGVRSLVLAGLGVPFLTGVIDLLLRWVTP